MYKTFREPVWVVFNEVDKEKSYTLHNILIFDLTDSTLFKFKQVHHIDSLRDVMYRFHPISLAHISYSDKKYFGSLPNTRVVVVAPDSSDITIQHLHFAQYFSDTDISSIIILTRDLVSVQNLKNKFPECFVERITESYDDFITKLGMKTFNVSDFTVPDVFVAMETDHMTRVISGSECLEAYIETGLSFRIEDIFFTDYYRFKSGVLEQKTRSSLVINQFSSWYYGLRGWLTDVMIPIRQPPPPELKPHLQLKVTVASGSLVTPLCFDLILEVLLKEFMLIPMNPSPTLMFNHRRKLNLNLYLDLGSYAISVVLSSNGDNTTAGKDIGVRQSDLQQLLMLFWRSALALTIYSFHPFLR